MLIGENSGDTACAAKLKRGLAHQGKSFPVNPSECTESRVPQTRCGINAGATEGARVRFATRSGRPAPAEAHTEGEAMRNRGSRGSCIAAGEQHRCVVCNQSCRTGVIQELEKSPGIPPYIMG